MVETDDPLLHGSVPPADGTFFNSVDQLSPNDTTSVADRCVRNGRWEQPREQQHAGRLG
jgi:hypothetical protein